MNRIERTTNCADFLDAVLLAQVPILRARAAHERAHPPRPVLGDAESQLMEHQSVRRLIAAWRAGIDSGHPAWRAGYGLRMFARRQRRAPGYRPEWKEGELLYLVEGLPSALLGGCED